MIPAGVTERYANNGLVGWYPEEAFEVDGIRYDPTIGRSQWSRGMIEVILPHSDGCWCRDELDGRL